MIRLPPFRLRRPRSLGDAADMLTAEGACEGRPLLEYIDQPLVTSETSEDLA